MRLSRVDLPEPDGPTIETSSPRAIERLTSASAVTRRLPSNCLLTPVSWIIVRSRRSRESGSRGSARRRPCSDRSARYTPQVPPKPMVTLSPSAITGTSRRPLVSSSIRSSPARSFLTLTYSNSMRRLAWSSRAADVYGHVSLPKM